MFCANCGNEIKDGSLFCEYCGAKQMGYGPEDGTIVQGQNSVQFGTQYNTQMSNQGYTQMPNQNYDQVPNQGANNENPNKGGNNGKKMFLILGSIISVLLVVVIVLIIIYVTKYDGDTKKASKEEVSTEALIDDSDETATATTPDDATGVVTGNVEEPTTEATETTETQVIEDGDVVSRDTAKAELQKLFDQALEYTRNDDYSSFCTLVRGVDDNKESIDNLYNILKKVIENDYPDFAYDIVWDDGTYFLCFIQQSMTTGAYPDYNNKYYFFDATISYMNNEWLFDCTPTADEKWSCEEYIKSVMSDEILAAYDAGRNASVFGGSDVSWINGDIVIPGALVSTVYLMWQNEDGSVDVMLEIKNGTDGIRNVYNIDVTITDDELGDVLNVSTDGGMIDPGKTKQITIHVDANEVKTGTSKWGNLHSNVNTDSK